jgi:hypothetical protein
MRTVMMCAIVTLALAPPASAPETVEVTPDAVRVRIGGALVLEYLRGGVPFKPYVSQLRTPGGVNVLRDHVADHLHHHGLMFAVRAGDVNFWEETPGCGTQRSTHVRTLRSGLQDSLAWWGPDAAAPLLQEERRVEVLTSADQQATLVDWRSTLALPREASGPVSLTGAHYHGLGMRFVQPMDGGSFTNAEDDPGTVFRGEERLMQGRWCAYRAAVDGRDVTVAMFDHPGNPRPATWFTMPRAFGYLAATLRLHEKPLELTAGKPVTLRYGVAVWDGNVNRDRIEKLCRAWLDRAGKER